MRTLRKENAELRRANEILRTTTGSPVVPIRTVLSEHGMPFAPSTYYAAKACPVSDADLADAYALLRMWITNRRLC